MTRTFTHRHWFACCLCVFLALACTLCVFLPHLHECDSRECSICALLSLFREALVSPLVTAALLCVAGLLYIRSVRQAAPQSASLVQLKVKLSD